MLMRWCGLLFASIAIVGTVPTVVTGLPDSAYAATAKKGCVFCDIVAGKEPATVIYETPDIVVIEKLHPTVGIDCLIIPKKHIENLLTLKISCSDQDPYDRRIMNEIAATAQHLSGMITGKGHFSLINNNGADAKQSVFHMHWHFEAPKSEWKPTVVMTQSPPKKANK
jgi:histidine triad (HIT) family protein